MFAGPRVAKDHPRITAYGAVDELNAVLGLLVASVGQESDWLLRLPRPDEASSGDGSTHRLREVLEHLQSDLFSIGAELATPDPEQHGMCLLTPERVQFLEACIDVLDGELPPLRQFVLPGGSHLSAQMHLARTVCRRAERDVVHLSHQPDTSDCSLVIIYLNRLSDFLFVLARWANFRTGIADVPWTRPAEPRLEASPPTNLED